MNQEKNTIGFLPILITETRPNSALFKTLESKTRIKFFAETSDPNNPEYCFATFWETKFGGIPLRPVASYWLRKKIDVINIGFLLIVISDGWVGKLL